MHCRIKVNKYLAALTRPAGKGFSSDYGSCNVHKTFNRKYNDFRLDNLPNLHFVSFLDYVESIR